MLLGVFTPFETRISKLSLCCTDESSEFHVSGLDGVSDLQGGFSFCVAC